jgi:hypothetical protein
MAKPIPSPSRNASARKRSNSSVARSGNSVGRKSKKSSDGGERLKIATPTDSKLRALKEAGLVVPEEIPHDDDSVPLDFTTLSNRDVGAVHSRYSVRHAHAIYQVALLAGDLVRRRRDLRIVESKFRVIHQGEKKTDVDALMEEDEKIARYRDKISLLEAQVEIVGAIAQGYEDLRNAASREMTRRIGEKAATD